MTARAILSAAGLIAAWLLALAAPAQGAELRIGSKKFTESVILGEIFTQISRHAGDQTIHWRELGGTRVVWNALRSGEIDAYPEYTGTLAQELLAGRRLRTDAQLRAALAEMGVRMSRSLGFNNTYAVGMKEPAARRLGIRAISDLRDHPGLRLFFTNEFMDRKDGWPGLRERYRLPQTAVRGLDHDLAYRALEAGSIEATDLYSTDAEILQHNLRVLEDDLGYFPAYRAVLLYRAGLEERAPASVRAMLSLEGKIARDAMVRMNAQAKIERVPEGVVASRFLAEEMGIRTQAGAETAWGRLLRHTREHLFLVGVSLGAAVLVALPLGIFAAKRPAAGQGILAVVGIIQTIPSLALLVFMIPLLGIGGPPAMVALFLYSLLPIVRNTHAGLNGIPVELRESSEALGLPPGARLRLIELPLASSAILAGIKTSAVINVGTATLGALIGAGGYGQPILTGIRLADTRLILEGAVPAALLALLAQGLFEGAERFLVSPGLRLKVQS
jgi:osmoprotectant transport system permease protein